ncbi:MAG: substrate-binding domain-containing protein [Fimbriimonas sp.]|nr:substrate-binding domain-containing protein [Fimbriimonas sp.]
MNKNIVFGTLAILGLIAAGCGSDQKSTDNATSGGGSGATTGSVKIGFLVKSMGDSWFQTETSFAKEEAKKLGADIEVQETLNGTAVLETIDTMATNGVQGIIICSPETQLGKSIQAAADRHHLKLMSVDDRLVGSDNKPLTEIPHLGISAVKIGNQVGQAIADEMKKRGWKPEEVGALAITAPNLETARQRVDGAKDIITANGFKKENVFEVPWTGSVDVASASDAANAVLTAHTNLKKWVVFSSNDDGVLGGIRSITNRGIPPTDIIGVGINGQLAAQEWEKGQPTGMYASILLQSKMHGAGTVEMMYKWIKDGTKPPMETYTSGLLITKDNYKDAFQKAGVPLK